MKVPLTSELNSFSCQEEWLPLVWKNWICLDPGYVSFYKFSLNLTAYTSEDILWEQVLHGILYWFLLLHHVSQHY